MVAEQTFHPLHVALKYVAATCIDENMMEEAESLSAFLDLIQLAPRTVGLLHVWTLSQRGHLREALRHCEELSERFPEAEEFTPLLAVLRYASNEPTWRSVCDRLLESKTASADTKRLAASLLDGTFGTKKAEAAETQDSKPAEPADALDFAAMGAYMRA